MYNAVGRKVSAVWVTETPTVNVGEPLKVTLVVHGAENPTRIRKPNLAALPAFANAFAIESVADPPAPAGEARFAYILRPRASTVIAVPELKFRFYVPMSQPGSEVQETYAKKLSIAVQAVAAPPVEVPPPLPPLAPSDEPGPFAWAGLVLGLIAGTAGYVVWWRYRNPSGPERERRLRVRATRRLQDRLATAMTTDDVAAAVREFAAVQPGAAELLATCDAARFAPADTNPQPLIDAARRLTQSGRNF